MQASRALLLKLPRTPTNYARAESLFVALRRGGLADVEMYETYVEFMRTARCGDVLKLFRQIKEDSISPRLRTYETFIKAFPSNSLGSLEVFADMRAQRIRPDRHLLERMIPRLVSTGEVDVARVCVEDYFNKHLGTDTAVLLSAAKISDPECDEFFRLVSTTALQSVEFQPVSKQKISLFEALCFSNYRIGAEVLFGLRHSEDCNWSACVHVLLLACVKARSEQANGVVHRIYKDALKAGKLPVEKTRLLLEHFTQLGLMMEAEEVLTNTVNCFDQQCLILLVQGWARVGNLCNARRGLAMLEGSLTVEAIDAICSYSLYCPILLESMRSGFKLFDLYEDYGILHSENSFEIQLSSCYRVLDHVSKTKLEFSEQFRWATLAHLDRIILSLGSTSNENLQWRLSELVCHRMIWEGLPRHLEDLLRACREAREIETWKLTGMLKACAIESWKSGAKQVEDVITKLPTIPVFAQNTRIMAFGVLGEMGRVLDVYNQLKESGQQPDQYTFIALLDALGRNSGTLERVKWILKEARQALAVQQVRREILTAAMEALIQLNHADQAVRLYKEYGNLRTSLSASAVKAYSKLGEYKYAKDIFEKAINSGLYLEKVRTMLIALIECAPTSNEVEELLTRVIDLGLQPRPSQFASAVSACERFGDLQRARRIRDLMIETGTHRKFKPRAHCYIGKVKAEFGNGETADPWNAACLVDQLAQQLYKANFVHVTEAIPWVGRVGIKKPEQVRQLKYHAEKKALAVAVYHQSTQDHELFINVNQIMCKDCNVFFNAAALLLQRQVRVVCPLQTTVYNEVNRRKYSLVSTSI